LTPVTPTDCMVRHGRPPWARLDVETLLAAEEACCKYPRRLFHRLLEQAVAAKPAPYTAMVRGIRGLPSLRQHNR
jgi:hypothetical protein